MRSRAFWMGLLGVAGLATAGDAGALTALTNNYCNPVVNGSWGIADQIDGTGGSPLGVGSGAPYNLVKTDDALVCVDAHQGLANQITFQNEVANTISHELGHLLGMEHGDGTAASLMNGAFDGTDKGFSAAAELAVLNANPNGLQVVWLDFQAAQPGLLAVYQAYSTSGVVQGHGIVGAAAVAASITTILGLVQADYAGPWTGGATFSFHLTAAAANTAAGGANYSTVSIVAVPEPLALLLLLAGGAGLSALRRRTVH